MGQYVHGAGTPPRCLAIALADETRETPAEEMRR